METKLVILLLLDNILVDLIDNSSLPILVDPIQFREFIALRVLKRVASVKIRALRSLIRHEIVSTFMSEDFFIFGDDGSRHTRADFSDKFFVNPKNPYFLLLVKEIKNIYTHSQTRRGQQLITH